MPTTSLLTFENNNEKLSVSQKGIPSCGSTIYSLKDIVLLDQSPIKSENYVDDYHELCNSVGSSCNKSFHIDPSTEKYPTIVAGVLRFSKKAPEEKHLRWWTVFNASDILYVELDDSEGCIGEAKPPIFQNECCCFSVYFKQNSNDVIRRVRLCCTKRSETLAWFFALRRSSQMANSRS
ncbi:hypothetical protein LSM04_002508 [Trypanosoma melophagium]|uniref:uncharacterized protein n=1 Tax=Trypanosoma melophagium TaxID=715481 RepID=UPI00351A27A0|nr:hypothetical protein LSM04_002508 [Trypanosoma melophagium]